MNTKAKIAIFLVAVIISLVGFNLLVSNSALGIVRMSQPGSEHIDVLVTAKAGSHAPAIVSFYL